MRIQAAHFMVLQVWRRGGPRRYGDRSDDTQKIVPNAQMNSSSPMADEGQPRDAAGADVV